MIGAGVTLILTFVGLVAGLAIFRDHTDTVFRAYFAVTGLLIALQTISNLSGEAQGWSERRTARGRRLPRRAPPNWPAELFELEDRLSLARVSAFDYESRLQPLLRELAAQRLAAHWQVDLERRAEAAEDHVGEALWEELQATHDASDARERRDLPGPTAGRLRQLIDDLEAI